MISRIGSPPPGASWPPPSTATSVRPRKGELKKPPTDLIMISNPRAIPNPRVVPDRSSPALRTARALAAKLENLLAHFKKNPEAAFETALLTFQPSRGQPSVPVPEKWAAEASVLVQRLLRLLPRGHFGSVSAFEAVFERTPHARAFVAAGKTGANGLLRFKAIMTAISNLETAFSNNGFMSPKEVSSALKRYSKLPKAVQGAIKALERALAPMRVDIESAGIDIFRKHPLARAYNQSRVLPREPRGGLQPVPLPRESRGGLEPVLLPRESRGQVTPD